MPTITGNLNERARMLVIDQDTWTIEDNQQLLSGDYELTITEGKKVIVCIEEDTDKAIAYGGVEGA